MKVQKRDGTIVDFNGEKISNAIFKAITATGQGDGKKSKKLTKEIIEILNRRFKKDETPHVEQIQDIVEEVLILDGLVETAKAYILYREQRRRIREAVKVSEEAVDRIDKYLGKLDWEVQENANMAFSLQGLNRYGVSYIIKRYWLNKVYPKEIRHAHLSGDFHIHNLDTLGTYCSGWDLYDLLIKGFGGVIGKVESRPAKHFRVALGQTINFLYTLQGEVAGAVAMSNFDTLLAPFIRYDNLNYTQVKQSLQEFLYNMAVPTRVGFQCPFTNITLDLKPSPSFADKPVIIGGKAQKETYAEFEEEMKVFNKAFYEIIIEGDKTGKPFHFPIPTINITKDFPWDDPAFDLIFQASGKYGTNYFANYINSEMKPEDVRSMCCRLRLDLKELHNRGGGGLFGAGALTGSIGVCTINMPRIGYLSKTKKDFFGRLGDIMDLAKESLEIKRKLLENYITKGLYPYSKYYLEGIKTMRNAYYANHFATIGLVGMNEALLNFIGTDITSRKGRKFSLEVMDFMRKKLVKYQSETNNIYNLEATPAESTAYRLALKDKKQYPDIIAAGTEKTPYYTNSSQLPVNYTTDPFEALKLQDDIQCKYSGGCIEKGNNVLTDKGLLPIEDIVNNFKELKPIKALSYNVKKEIAEWDEILEAIKIDVKKHNKIRVKGERNLDITTSNWHPFFVLERIKINPSCPVCQEKVINIKGFATHLRWNKECREEYQVLPKYKVVEKRADELKSGDYILQNSYNLYPDSISQLNDDLMWLIGFFIGDGCISKFIDNRGGNSLKRYRVRFFSSDQKSLRKVSQILSKYFDCKANVIRNDKRSAFLREVSTSKREVWEFFFKYGFKAGKKVYNIFIPQEVKNNIRKNNIFALLGGLIDSDGNISRDGSIEYFTVSANLAKDILEVCSTAGIIISKFNKFTKRKNEKNGFRLIIPAYEATRRKAKLNPTINPLRIRDDLSDRKKRHLPVVRVKEASKVNVKDNQFYDLMIKKNHNYLAGKDCLVFIHNTVLHLFLGENISDVSTVKAMVKKVFENFHLPYITITPTFSICPAHGYLSGEHFYCPKCAIKQPCEVYSRIVGYIRPVSQWNDGKKREFKDRKEFKIKKNSLTNI
ncbi:MAG: ribonucleoside triphosphate reductase [Candidatus Nealsonbacteria bacterium]